MHEPLRTADRRSAAALDRVEAVGAAAEPDWFPDDGLVQLDLHTDNVLVGDDGTLTGIVDWEGACAGDHRPSRRRSDSMSARGSDARLTASRSGLQLQPKWTVRSPTFVYGIP